MEIKQKIISEIKKIYDPEIPVNIYELGLIYDIIVNGEEDFSSNFVFKNPNETERCGCGESFKI